MGKALSGELSVPVTGLVVFYFQFLERLDYFEYLSYRHKQELLDKTKQDIQEDIEKKLAGQHKLSKKDEEMYEALNGKWNKSCCSVSY